MKSAFEKLNIYHKCSVLSGLFILLLSIVLIPFYFFNLMDIPFGFLIGGVYGITVYFVTGILENKRQDYYKWAILISAFRYLVFAALLVLVGLCYYKWDIKIFNIFTVVGGYLICLVVFVILFILQNKKERKMNGSI